MSWRWFTFSNLFLQFNREYFFFFLVIRIFEVIYNTSQIIHGSFHSFVEILN